MRHIDLETAHLNAHLHRTSQLDCARRQQPVRRRPAFERHDFLVQNIGKPKFTPLGKTMVVRKRYGETVAGIGNDLESFDWLSWTMMPMSACLFKTADIVASLGRSSRSSLICGFSRTNCDRSLRQPLNKDRTRRTDANVPPYAGAMLVQADFESSPETEHIARIIHHGDAGRCRLDAVRPPHDQRRTQLLFKQAHPPARRGQRDVEALRRLAHAPHLARRQENHAGFGDRDKAWLCRASPSIEFHIAGAAELASIRLYSFRLTCAMAVSRLRAGVQIAQLRPALTFNHR